MRIPTSSTLVIAIGASPCLLACASTGGGWTAEAGPIAADDGGATSAVDSGRRDDAGTPHSVVPVATRDAGGESDGAAVDSATTEKPVADAAGTPDAAKGAGAGPTAYIAKYGSYSAQYYVSPSGSDGNPGTESKPWATLSHADSAAPACSVVWFASGTYSASSGRLAHTNGSGTASCHRAFVSQTYGGAQLEAPNNTEDGDTTWWSEGSYVDIVGFDISGSSCEAVYATGNYTTFGYNRVHDVDNATDSPPCGDGTGGGGLVQAIGSSNFNYYGNTIWNIGQHQNRFVHGIYVAGPGAVVENNLVYNAAGGCIQGYHSAENVSIVNNTLVDCQNTGMWVGGAACSPAGIGSGYTIANNIIADSPAITGYAISEWCDSGSVTGWVISNNLVYESGTVTNGSISGASSPTKTVTSSPLFVDEASPSSGGDFHLDAGSPAIGAGTATGAPPADFDGESRGTPPAIGAFE